MWNHCMRIAEHWKRVSKCQYRLCYRFDVKVFKLETKGAFRYSLSVLQASYLC